jgi:pimeloyl-ACP methyl ester carboxylesterase
MENRLEQKGREFDLNFMILPSRNPNPAPDPIIVLDGGPGLGSTDRAVEWARHLNIFRHERNIILFDQRGTGGSNPLPCRRLGNPEEAQTYLEDMFPEEYVERCRKELDLWFDLRYYHTTIAMEDIHELRAALGYDLINLYGASYGSHSAAVYLNNFPETVRAAILEVPGYPSSLYPSTLAQDTEVVLQRLFLDCAADPDCAADYPDFMDEFYAVLDRVRQNPVMVNITNPINGQPETVFFPYNTLIAALRSMLYSTYSQRWIPAFIHWAYRGNYSPLVEWEVEGLHSSNTTLKFGLLLCVTCTESIPYIDFETARAEAAGTMMGTYRLDQQERACDLWERGEIPAGFHDPPHWNVPTLLISGELDPTVRPATVAVLDASLPKSFHYMAPNCAHSIGPAWEGGLAQEAARFMSQAGFEGLDFSGPDSTQRPPFASWRDYVGESIALVRVERK